MSNLTTITPADTFRAEASGLLAYAANMSLHELVDEFQRLTSVMDENYDPDSDYPKLSHAGQVAQRKRNVIEASARARFGLSLEPFDRISMGGMGDW